MDKANASDISSDNSGDSSAPSQLAVITGASSGIGFELAKQFAQHGFDLLVTAEGDDINAAADTLRSLGARVDTVEANLATYDGVEKVYGKIKSMGRPVDAVAINAGVGVGGAFIDTDLNEDLNLIALNVTSSVHLAYRVLKDMAARGEGRVLFTSSIAADGPGPFESCYAASKAFILSFAEAVRNELKDTGVSVTALQPGPTATNFFNRAHMEDTKVATGKKSDPANIARAGFDALMSGEDHVVAGSMKTKAQGVMSHVAPETMKAEQHRKESAPGSANK